MQEQRNNDVIEIDLGELFGVLLHRWWLIVLSMIVTGAVAFVISAFVLTPKYESTTGIYVMSKQDESKLSYSDTQLSSQLTQDYEELIKCRYVLESVIEECDLEDTYDDLLGRVSISNATGTRILYITVKDPDPAMAQYIANSIREAAAAHITSVTEVDAVNVVDMANLPATPSEPSVPKWTVIGILLGFIASAGMVILQYILDDTIKTSEDAEKYLGWSTLALIPMIAEEGARKSVSKKAVAVKSQNS